MKSPESSGSKNITVWLVEDNHNYSKTLMRAFGMNNGIDCNRHFGNAKEMLHSLKTEAAPQVVLLDVALPGMDGIEAIKMIKQHSPAVNILMLTVFEDEKKIFRAIHAGAAGYLLKTASLLEIRNSVEQVVAGGAPMTPKVARLVLKMFSALPEPPKDYGLTDREQEILQLMTRGLIKKEIAEQLRISYNTVDFHIRNIFKKMSVRTTHGAVGKAMNK